MPSDKVIRQNAFRGHKGPCHLMEGMSFGTKVILNIAQATISKVHGEHYGTTGYQTNR